MANEKKLTKRQLEALVNVYFGYRYEGRREYERNALTPKDLDEIPPWGYKSGYGYTSNMGGAANRMGERLGNMGFFPLKVSDRGHAWHNERTLTAKALHALKGKYPTLPNIDERITEREKVEADEKAAEEAERVESKKALEQSRIARREKRIKDFIDICAKYGLAPVPNDEDRIIEICDAIVESDVYS